MYAAKCLEHARDLWEFALNYQGSYSDHIETGEKYKVKKFYSKLHDFKILSKINFLLLIIETF